MKRLRLVENPPVDGQLAAVNALSEKSFNAWVFSENPCPACGAHHDVLLTFGPDEAPLVEVLCTASGEEFHLDRADLLKLANTVEYWQRGIQKALQGVQA